jgi:hypothetical protein
MSFIVVKDPSLSKEKSAGVMLATHWSSCFLAAEQVSLSEDSNNAIAQVIYNKLRKALFHE